MRNLLAAILIATALNVRAQQDEARGPERRDPEPRLPAAAQDSRDRPGEPRRSAVPQSAPGGAAGPDRGSSQVGHPAAMQFLRWAVGDGTHRGAFKAPKLCCRLLHDISNTYVGPRVGAYEGLDYSIGFVRDILAGARVCPPGPSSAPGRHGRPAMNACGADEPLGLPEHEVLAVAPQPVREWLSKTRATYHLSEYFRAADPDQGEKDAQLLHAMLGLNREKFFEVAFKTALGDPSTAAAFCSEIEPRRATCPGEMATLAEQSKTEEIYRRARAGLSR